MSGRTSSEELAAAEAGSLAPRRRLVNETLLRWGQAEELAAEMDHLPVAQGVREALGLTIRYGLTPVRSVLLLAACEAVGGEITEDVRRAGLAMQMFGLFLHVHDDLIDQTDAISSSALPSIHASHGTNTALVIGDLLLLRSTTCLSRALWSALLREEALCGLALFERAGIEVADAQLRELAIVADLDVTPEACLLIAQTKIAEFAMCMKIGGLLGRGDREDLEALGDYGRCMGTLMVLRGDLVDVFYRRDSLLGRLRHETVPLPILIAASRSPEARLLLQSLQNASDIDDEQWTAIVGSLARTGAIEDTMRIVTELGLEARSALGRLRRAGSLPFLEAMIDVASSCDLLPGFVADHRGS